MPLYTEYQKKVIIQRHGLDPEEYDVDEAEGSIVPKIKKSPPISTTPTLEAPIPTKAKSSTIGSFLHGVEENLGGAAVGLGAAAGTMALIPTPVTTIGALGAGALALGTGFLGSMAGSFGQRKAEQAILPTKSLEELEASRQQAREEHPIANFIGQLAAPSPAVGISKTVLKQAGSGLAKTAFRNEAIAGANAIEKAALRNVATGAGVSGGLEIAGEAFNEDEAFSPSKIALATIAGALQNQPTKLGQKVFRLKRSPVTPEEITRARLGPNGLPEVEDVEATKKKEAKKAKIEEFPAFVKSDDPTLIVANEREALFKKNLAEAGKENENAIRLYGKEKTLTPETLIEEARNRTEKEFSDTLAKRNKEEKQKAFDLAANDEPQGIPFTFKEVDAEGKETYGRSSKEVKEAALRLFKQEGFDISFLKKHKITPDDAEGFSRIVSLNEGEIRGLLDQQLFPAVDNAVREKAAIEARDKREIELLAKENAAKQAEIDILRQRQVDEERLKSAANNSKLSREPVVTLNDRQQLKEANYKLFKELYLKKENREEAIKFARKDLSDFLARLKAEQGGVIDIPDFPIKKLIEPKKGTKFEDVQDIEEAPFAPKAYVTPREQEILGGVGVSKIKLQREIRQPDGSEAAGKAEFSPEEGSVVSLSAKRGLDTPIHEALELDRLNVQRNGTESQKALWKRGEDLAKESVNLLGEESPLFHRRGSEEGLVQKAGKRATELEYARQKKELANRIKFWWQDLGASIKNRKGKASAEEVKNLLARRLLDAPNYFESGIAARDIQSITGIVPKSAFEDIGDGKFEEGLENAKFIKEIEKAIKDGITSASGIRKEQSLYYIKLAKSGLYDSDPKVLAAFEKQYPEEDRMFYSKAPKLEDTTRYSDIPEGEQEEVLSRPGVIDNAEGKDIGKELGIRWDGQQSFGETKYWAFTDRKPGKSDKATFYVKEGSSKEEVLKALEEKRKAFGVEGYQDVEDSKKGGNVFTYEALKLLDNPSFFAQGKDAKFLNKESFIKRLKKGIPKDEYDTINIDGAFESWLKSKGERVSLEEAKTWIKENGPKINVETYGMEGKVSEAKKEYDRMTHEWLERQSDKVKKIMDDADYAHNSNEAALDILRNNLSGDTLAKALRYHELSTMPHASAKTPKATSAYDTVSALPTNEPMPEWTATKSRKNVQRVDVVVPQKRIDNYTTPVGNVVNTGEVPLWKQDNLHENLPNTIGWAMIQYKTGPKGEKIAVIAEAQSRWGQEARKMELTSPRQNHPLLKDYNRLVLKAAIEQARKEGATHIMVSDDFSARISEGHDLPDQQGYWHYSIKGSKAHIDSIIKNLNNVPELETIRFQTYDNAEGSTTIKTKENSIDIHEALNELGFKLPTEEGMRLNYDTILPNIAEKITGQKGVRVSLGDHKNAFEATSRDEQEWSGKKQQPRPNLIFRNADGTPKTDISGLLFSLAEVSKRRETGEPFSLFGTKYQDTTAFTPREEAALKENRYYLPGIRSEIDKVRLENGKEGEIVSKAANNFWAGKTFHQAKLKTDLLTPFLATDLSATEREKIGKYLWSINEGRSLESAPYELSPAYQKVVNEYDAKIKAIGKLFQEEGPQIRRGDDYSELRVTDYPYYPNMVSEEVLKVIRDGGKEEARIKKLWTDHALSKDTSLSPAEAAKAYEEYKTGLSFRGRAATADIKFGAIRKAQGYGLPYELVEKDPLRLLERYGNRAGADFSYFKYIQNSPEVLKILNLKDQFGQYVDEAANPDVTELSQLHTKPEIQNMMESIYGLSDYQHNPIIMPTARLLSSGILGWGTAIRNIAQIPNQIVSYKDAFSNTPKALSKLFSGYGELSNRSLSSGATKKSYKSFDVSVGDDFESTVNRWEEFAGKASDFLRKIQGRNLSDNLEGMFFHSLGEELAEGHIRKIGEKDSEEFIRKFSSIVDDIDAKVKNPSKFSKDDIQKMASEFATTIRGTYDSRQLPTSALRGQIAPFLSLARWSIGKSNVMMRDVVNPAIEKGNYRPLIKTLLTSLGVGYGIEELNELISGKKSEDAKVGEVLSAGSTEDKAAKVVDLLQLSSFMGIVSDIGKMGVKAGQGKDFKFSSPVNFPLWTWTTETMAGNISDASKAIQDGEDPIDVLGKLVVAIGSQSIQSARYVKNYAQPEETSRKNDFRDLRVYQDLAGDREASRNIPKENIYQGIDQKRFKRTSSIEEATDLLPRLVEKSLHNSIDRTGALDIEKLKSSLRGLKINSYQTMPDPEQMPTKFSNYLVYLTETQGEEVATERLIKYLTQKNLNRVKSSMVPSY